MRPMLIAHRGDAANFPENTPAAFRSAFEQGAEGVEFDVHCHDNGDVVIVHDFNHDHDGKYPLLADVLDEFGQHGRLEIELKVLEAACVKRIAEIVQQHNPPDFEITTSELPLLPVIREHFPKNHVGMLFKHEQIEPWMTTTHIQKRLLNYLKLTGADTLHLNLELYTPEIIEMLHENGYLAHSHFPDSGNLHRLKKAAKLGIDFCTFDDMAFLKYTK